MADRYEAMFMAAVQSLAEISKALGIPDDEAACANGNELILEAIQVREEMLGNLLARIHRDGGQYVAEQGWEKAAAEAEDKVVEWLARDDAPGVTPCDEAQQEYEPVGDFIARPQPDGEPLWERAADWSAEKVTLYRKRPPGVGEVSRG